MSDQLTYLIPSTSTVECAVCEADNEVTYWDDIRTGRWERDAFTCTCGEHHRAIEGTSLDRGTTTAAASLFWLGFVMVAAPLTTLFLIPWTLTHLYLILTGALLVAGITALAAVAAIQRRNHS